MTRLVVATEFEACVDCVAIIANGEASDADGNDISAEHAARMSRIWSGYRLVMGNADESWFSWHRCDGCHDTLGGDRFECVALESTP